MEEFKKGLKEKYEYLKYTLEKKGSGKLKNVEGRENKAGDDIIKGTLEDVLVHGSLGLSIDQERKIQIFIDTIKTPDPKYHHDKLEKFFEEFEAQNRRKNLLAKRKREVINLKIQLQAMEVYKNDIDLLKGRIEVQNKEQSK